MRGGNVSHSVLTRPHSRQRLPSHRQCCSILLSRSYSETKSTQRIESRSRGERETSACTEQWMKNREKDMGCDFLFPTIATPLCKIIAATSWAVVVCGHCGLFHQKMWISYSKGWKVQGLNRIWVTAEPRQWLTGIKAGVDPDPSFITASEKQRDHPEESSDSTSGIGKAAWRLRGYIWRMGCTVQRKEMKRRHFNFFCFQLEVTVCRCLFV